MLWVLVILLLILTFRRWVILVAGIASVVGPLIGYFLVVWLFLLVGALLLVAAAPVYHWIASLLGPQIVDQYVTPLIGMTTLALIFLGLYDSMTGWKMTRSAYNTTRNLFAFRQRQ